MNAHITSIFAYLSKARNEESSNDESYDDLIGEAWEINDRINHNIPEKILNLQQKIPDDPNAPYYPDVLQLKAIFQRFSAPQSYIDMQKERMAILVDTLIDNPRFLRAARNWGSQSNRSKRRLLQLTQNTHQSTYVDFATPYRSKVILRSQAPRIVGGKKLDPAYADYMMIRKQIIGTSYHRVRFNTDLSYSKLHTFSAAMNVSHHEGTHAMQFFWASTKNSYANFMHPDITEYWKAAIELPYSHIKSLHRSHPLEIDAYRQGNVFSAMMAQALYDKGIGNGRPYTFPEPIPTQSP